MGTASRDWQRARRPEQKAERRTTILRAAAKLLDEDGIDGTGINAIAREAGISKPNLYRYFESREAILLELLVEEHRCWAADFASRLAQLDLQGDVSAVGSAFAESIADRQRYCVLIGAVATVLEHNVGVDTVVAFKRNLLKENGALVSAFKQALPLMDEGRCFSVVAMLLMAASGFWPHCHPSPVVQTVLQQPEFASMRFDFKSVVQYHAESFIRGQLKD